MAKKVKTKLKLNIRGGQANPAPPVGPALGQHGVQIMDFCNKYNEATKDKQGQMVPVVVTIYEDRSFDFVLKLPPVSELIKQELNIKEGSHEPGKDIVATLTQEQAKKIAEKKLGDLNTKNVDQAAKIVAGSARSMGITVK